MVVDFKATKTSFKRLLSYGNFYPSHLCAGAAGEFLRGTDGCLFPDVAGTCSSFVEVGGEKMGGEEKPLSRWKGS